MSQKSLLNKPLWNNITRLKLLNKPDAPVKFILEKSPFDEEEIDAAAPKDIITGRILPNSKIYCEGAYRIEIKLLPTYPSDPPEVRFLTPIYHPNIDKGGKYCAGLLRRIPCWRYTTSLVDIIIDVAKHIDQPDIDSSASFDIGREYMEHKSEFDRKALEYVKKYALPRH